MSNIDLADLQVFACIARHQNLQQAALELHLSVSALSRTLKRLESRLNTPLFDRIGRNLQLNADGERLRGRALELMGLAERTVAEFVGTGRVHCRVLGPPLLHWRWGRALAECLQPHIPDLALSFVADYEAQALVRLQKGEGDIALVTGAALQAVNPEALVCTYLGATEAVLAAGARHPLVLAGRLQLDTATVLTQDFVCPRHSLYCGLDRGQNADGWRNERWPRRIKVFSDDLNVLLDWVQAGQALAYLPDFVLERWHLQRLELNDADVACHEDMWLVYRRATATGWQQGLADRLRQPQP